ncbi:MAG: trehalose-phosphatase, partial [Pseudomonadota bacterium]
PPPAIDFDRMALFLDFDGTLVDFAERPDLVQLEDSAKSAIAALQQSLSGALAVVTGRDIAAVDHFLAPLTVPVAGVHGLARRDADGRLFQIKVDQSALDHLTARLGGFAAKNPGLLVERKSASVALHYRRAETLGLDCKAEMAEAIADLDGFILLQGHCVVEARSDRADKGRAIAAFLNEPPFTGRVPVFAGDDVTDEDGFAVVNDNNGLSIKIGPESSAARYRFATRGAFQDWLIAQRVTAEAMTDTGSAAR